MKRGGSGRVGIGEGLFFIGIGGYDVNIIYFIIINIPTQPI
jgi:hypothetical protein